MLIASRVFGSHPVLEGGVSQTGINHNGNGMATQTTLTMGWVHNSLKTQRTRAVAGGGSLCPEWIVTSIDPYFIASLQVRITDSGRRGGYRFS